MLNFNERKYNIFFHLSNILDILISKGNLETLKYTESIKPNDIVYEYLKLGIESISEGKSPIQLSIIMECEKMRWIRGTTTTTEDLQLISIIQHSLPYIQSCDIESFLLIAHCICPREKYDIIYYLLHKQ